MSVLLPPKSYPQAPACAFAFDSTICYDYNGVYRFPLVTETAAYSTFLVVMNPTVCILDSVPLKKKALFSNVAFRGPSAPWRARTGFSTLFAEVPRWSSEDPTLSSRNLSSQIIFGDRQ
jgi:hypothetical protein